MALSSHATKRLISLHGWTAMALSALLYAVVLTGTIIVLDHEIDNWAQGYTNAPGPVSRGIDTHVERFAKQVPDEFKEAVRVSEGPNRDLQLSFQGHRINREGVREDSGRVFVVDPSGGILKQSAVGSPGDLRGSEAGRALERFLVDLHVRMHVPGRWGLYLTGILGVTLLISAFTGILIHRHIVKEMFVTERPGNRIVSVRDRHNLAGVWSLPFAILLSFTGAFLSFAVSLGLPVVALVAFGGDQEKAIESIVQSPALVDATPQDTASLDAILLAAYERTGVASSSVFVSNFGRADAIVETYHSQRSGELKATTLQFSGATGEFLRERQLVGDEPSVGTALAELMIPLHFGNFAGLASRIVWVALGAAMTFTIVSGIQLWLRRREDDPSWAAAQRALVTVVWGLPIALTASGYGYFLSRLSGDPLYWTPTAFLLAAAGVIGIAVILRSTPLDRLAFGLKRTLAILLLLLPFLRLQMGGLSWGEALIDNGRDVLFIDALCLIGGAVFLDIWRGQRVALHRQQSPVAGE